MESDDLEFTCPCCRSSLGLDQAGDLYTIVDHREGKTGLGGIKTFTEAGMNNEWRQDYYLASEQKQYEPPVNRIAGIAGRHNQSINSDAQLMAASEQDWKQKNIKSTDTNND